jgi:hypothetical protein
MIRPLHGLLAFAMVLPAGAVRAQSSSGPDRARTCPAPPRLVLSPGFEDPRRIFAPAGRSFRALETRFASAYWLACRSGSLTAAFRPGRLVLKNAPDANTTSIYRDGEEREGRASGPMVMEHPFIGHGRKVDIPSVEELRSAILCSVYSLDPPGGPAQDVLECLVD